jgi:hypothetical protein
VRKEQADVIRSYPTRSVEYFIGRQKVWPVALLKSSCPDLALPIVKYKYRKELQPGEEPPILCEIDVPINYSFPNPKESNSMPMDEEKDKKPFGDKGPDNKPPKDDEEKAVDKATKAESKGSKTDNADISDLKQLMSQLSPLLAMLPDLQALSV